MRLRRRTFLALLLAAALAWAFLRFGRGPPLAERIRAFFALEPRHRQRVEAELKALVSKNPGGWAATQAFFVLDGSAVAALVPRSLRREILRHWSEKLLSPRSVGWPWLGYPPVADTAVCDGLVKPAA